MRYPFKVLSWAAALAAMLGAAPMAAAEDYDPKINPADFTTEITNPFFNLPVGKRMVYQGETEDGEPLRIVIAITGATKTIMGVETLVYRDKEYEDGERHPRLPRPG
jgi:hypothetical protein